MIGIRKSPIFLIKMMYPSESNTIVFCLLFLIEDNCIQIRQFIWRKRKRERRKETKKGRKRERERKNYAIND